LAALSCGFEADGADEGIEVIDNALIEAIKLRSPLGLVPRGPFGRPALKLVSDVAQGGPRHRIDLSISIEEADDPLRLLERLNQPIEQNAVETTIVPTDIVFVVLEEGVHDRLELPVQQPGS
jgi:hypothetical protein